MTIITTFPYTISNGQNVDAIPVMADFNYIQSQVNANVPTAISTATSGAMSGNAATATLAATATNALACSGNSATATLATTATTATTATNQSGGTVNATTGVFSGLLTPSTTNGIKGTALADNAIAGSVGEFITNQQTASHTGSGVALTGLASITLTAGDWDVWGSVYYLTGGATVTQYSAFMASGTYTMSNYSEYLAGVGSGNGCGGMIPIQRVNSTSGGAISVTSTCLYSVATPNVTVIMFARRVR